MLPKKVFCSYAHKDENFLAELKKHASILRQSGAIEFSWDGMILPGQEWAEQINSWVEEADIILLLVSADFLSSEYCRSVEAKRAFERHRERSAIVVPIILRDCEWKTPELRSLQALPEGGRPVCKWATTDEAFTNVVKGLARLLQHLDGAPRPAVNTPEPRKPETPRPASGGTSAGVAEETPPAPAPKRAATAVVLGSTGLRPEPLLPFPMATIRCLAWSPNGKLLAALGRDAVRVWSTEGNWPEVDSFDTDNAPSAASARNGILELLSLAWFGSDTIIMTTRHDLILWHPTGEPAQRIPVNSQGWLWGISCPPTLPLVALGEGLNGIHLHNLKGGPTPAFPEGQSPIYKPAWSHSGNHLACGSEDGTVTICDAREWTLTKRPPIEVGYPGIHVTAWSPKDDRLACGTWKGPVVLMNPDGTNKRVLQLKGHKEQVDQLSFSADGRWLASKGQDQKVIVWDTENCRSEGEVREQIAFLGGGATFHPSRFMLATLSEEPGQIRIWSK
jgi:WD40 repeat protein